MALYHSIRRIIWSSQPTLMRYAFFHEGVKDQIKENSSEYSSDGEKIYCDLKFKKEGDKTEEELASILESARAKAFSESLNRVVNINKNDEA